MNTLSKIKPSKKQSGAATLIFTLVIIIAMTIGSFSMIHSSSMEKRMSANDFKSRQAMQSAQAGIDYFMASLSGVDIDPSIICANDTLENHGFLLNFTGPDSTGQLDFDPETQSEACLNIPFGIVTRTSIWSRGFDQDRESFRTLLSTVDMTASWDFRQRIYSSYFSDEEEQEFYTDAPLVSLNNIELGNATSVRTCDMPTCIAASDPGAPHTAFSNPPSGVLMLAGGKVGANGALPTSHPWKNTSSNAIEDSQMIKDMSSDDFFSTYFANGNTKSEYIDVAYTLQPTETLTNTIMAQHSNIYIPPNHPILSSDKKLNNTLVVDSAGKSQIGSSAKQVNIFVDGNVAVKGNGTIWANIYATGKFTGAGTGKYMGRVIAEGDIDWGGNVSVLSPNQNPSIPPGGGGGEPPSAIQDDFDQDAYEQIRSTTIRIGSWREIVN